MKLRLVALFTAVALCSTALADDAEKLRELRAKFELEEGNLKQLRAEKEKLSSDLSTIKEELITLEKNRRTEEGEVKRLALEIQAVEISKVETERRLTLESELLEERLIALYKVQKRRQGVGFLLASASAQDLLRRGHILSILASRGDQTLHRLSSLKDDLVREELRYEALRNEKAKRVDELTRIAKEVELRKTESQVLLGKVEARERDQNRVLAKLRQEMKNLEKALASVMGEEEESPAPRDDFKGPGLASVRGKLPYPVTGTILQSFGKAQHEDFADAMVVKGIEFQTGVGSAVRPVATGKVVLAQVLPGFGNVVIVDHGERYYSLYGRLASTYVKPGDVVQVKDTLGVVGEPDHRGRNCYFELRYRGKAVDPREYLKKG